MRLSRIPTVHMNVETTNSVLGEYTEIGAMSLLENVDMGCYSYCGPGCIIQNATIGRFANIAASVRIGPTMHPMDRPTLHHFTYRRRLYGFSDRDDQGFFAWRATQKAIIGHDTWLGHGAIIMPNVAVGNGAVVGAGAVLTHDVPPYTVAVGVPARVVKKRFTDEIAEAIEQISWWNWSHETIRSRLADFSGPVEEFVEKYNRVSEETEVARNGGAS